MPMLVAFFAKRHDIFKTFAPKSRRSCIAPGHWARQPYSVANIDTTVGVCHNLRMADRQTKNVSLTPQQDRFVQAMVEAGRYRTASEVVRDGLRLLEEAEHRRLLEKWVYESLTPEEEARLPQELKDRARAHFQGMIDEAMQDIKQGRVVDGPTAMKRLREELKARSR